VLAAAAGLPLATTLATPVVAQPKAQPGGPFWPGGARLAVCVSVQLETEGGQTNGWPSGPAGTPQASQRFPNFPNAEVRTYAGKEGMPRLLDMLDRVGVKMSSYMIGQSIERFPDLARDIVARGHEAGGRG
jgi:hypothetical protein